MINIKDIKKVRGNHYVVTFIKNDKEFTSMLPEETVINHNLFTSRTMTDSEYQKMCIDQVQDTLLNKALFFINYKQRTISEVKKHLKKQTQDEELIQRIIQILKSKRYLNDNEYAKQYVQEKIDFDLVGPKYIKEKLISKGIHFDLIDAHLIQYNENIEYNKIRELIEKETKYTIKKPYIKAYQSIKGKLVNKGFHLHIIESAMISASDLIKDAVDEDALLEKEINLLKKQYNIKDFQEKDKLIKKLLQKGFRYDIIKDHLV